MWSSIFLWGNQIYQKAQKTAIMWTSNTTMFDTGLMLQNFSTSITKTLTHLHLWFVLCWDFWLSSFQRLFLGHVSFLHCWHLSLPSIVIQLVLKYWNRCLIHKSQQGGSLWFQQKLHEYLWLQLVL
jgi:hypothetical protein